MNKALFLDRDGVINNDLGYVHKREDVIFLPGIFELVKKAKSLNYLVVIVTNQAGIGRGYFTVAQFNKLTEWMKNKFLENDGFIDAVYYCPYHPTEGIGNYKIDSPLRKPYPGMIHKAALDLDINLSDSIMVGDNLTDMQAGESAGINKLFLYRKKSNYFYSIDSLSQLINYL